MVVSTQLRPRGLRLVLLAVALSLSVLWLVGAGYVVLGLLTGSDDRASGTGSSGPPAPSGADPSPDPSPDSSPDSSPSPTPDAELDDAEVAADRSAGFSAAGAFVSAVFDFGPADLDDAGELADYRADVVATITPGLAERIAPMLDEVQRLVSEEQQSGSVVLGPSGLARLGDDRATVLVSAQVTIGPQGRDGERTDVLLAVRLTLTDSGWVASGYRQLRMPPVVGLDPRADERIESEAAAARAAAVAAVRGELEPPASLLAAGVTASEPGRVELMVIIRQRAGRKGAATDPLSVLQVTMVEDEGKWLVEDSVGG